MEPNEMNKIDLQIVNLLSENARMSFSEIGKRVGLSRVAVKNRVVALEKNGIIKGYHAEIDRLAPSDNILFYAYLFIGSSEKFGEILEEVKRIPSVRYVYRLSGGNAIVVFGTASSARYLQNFAWNFQNRKEIESVTVKEVWSVEKGPAGDDGLPLHYLLNGNIPRQENKQ